MCEYFFFLLLSHLQKFSRSSPTLEFKLEEVIRRKCKAVTMNYDQDNELSEKMINSNVWLKLSQELLVPSPI